MILSWWHYFECKPDNSYDIIILIIAIVYFINTNKKEYVSLFLIKI